MYIQNRNTATTDNCTQAALQICCGGWLNSIEANMSSNMRIGTVQFHMSCSAPVVVPARAAKAATAANSAGSNACREKNDEQHITKSTQAACTMCCLVVVSFAC